MPTNLTGSIVSQTYSQLLHIDGGPEAAEKTVYSATGVATAVKLGTQSMSVDNLQLDGNTITSLDADGDIELTPDGVGAVKITNLDATGGTASGVALDGPSLLSSGDLGHSIGAGGTVTQTGSRTASVSLNANCGQITLVAGSLAAHEADEFTFSNTRIEVGDMVVLSLKSGADAGTRKYYSFMVTSVSAGACTISVGNLSAGTVPASSTDTLVLGFSIIKGVTT